MLTDSASTMLLGKLFQVLMVRAVNEYYHISVGPVIVCKKLIMDNYCCSVLFVEWTTCVLCMCDCACM